MVAVEVVAHCVSESEVFDRVFGLSRCLIHRHVHYFLRIKKMPV